MEKVLGVIPARFLSSRFPGKPLVHILGKSLIQRTYQNASLCTKLSDLVVATDDRRIFDHVLSFGGKVVMTSPNCLTGSDRIAEVIEHHTAYAKASIIVNIQGDEPCLEPEAIQQVIEILQSDPKAVVSTAVTRLFNEEEALNPSIVKCVFDQMGNALYFSRALIPAKQGGGFSPKSLYYRHLGLYAYRRDFLLKYAKLTPTPLQLAEDLEQLKILEHGYRIKTAIVKAHSIGVDTPNDIKIIEQIITRASAI